MDMSQVWRSARPISGGSDNDEPEAPEGAEPEAPPAPAFVTQETFAQEAAQTRATLAALNDTMARLNEGLRAPAAPARVPDAGKRMTREDWLNAINSQDVVALERWDTEQKEALIAEHVAPLRDQGLGAIANLTRDTVTPGLPYYKRYQKEIDEVVNTFPPGMRMQAEVYRTAHDLVKGRHAEELIAEAREAALRGPAEPDAVPQGNGRGRAPRADAVPAPDDLADGMSRALHGAGKDSDTMARKMGYADWKDYMTKTKEYAQ